MPRAASIRGRYGRSSTWPTSTVTGASGSGVRALEDGVGERVFELRQRRL